MCSVRNLAEWSCACDVIAPPLVPKRTGAQRKRDKRVSLHPAMVLAGARVARTSYTDPAGLDARVGSAPLVVSDAR